MSGADFTDVDTYGLLEELYDEDTYYQEGLVNSFHNFIRNADKGEVSLDGKGWNIGAVGQLNESYAAINDAERLPDSSYTKGVFAKYRPKLMYSTIEMTSFAATRGHKGGRPNGKFIDDNIKATMLAFMANLDADAMGNGRGYRATVASATPSATSFTVDFSKRLRPGMKCDWYNSTLTVKRGSIAISFKGIDRITRTVYIDPAFGTGAVPAGATADDVLVVYGALQAGEPTDGRYMGGFERITDNSVAIGGLASSAYAWWSATNINAGLANPSQEILQQETDAIYTIAGVYANKMAFNSAWKRAYLIGFLNQRRFTSNSFDTGASSLTWSQVRMGKDDSGKKVVTLDMLEDEKMDPSKVYIWNDKAVCRVQDYGQEPHLADEDGSEFRYRRNYDSMQGFVRFWENLVVCQRAAIGSIYNFAQPSDAI